MNLEDLKALVAVVEAGSVREGAKRVFKTQPAVSQALKRLEAELELEIYDRQHYRFALTPQGQAILERAKRLLSEAEDFKSYAEHLTSGIELSFHFAAQSSIDLPLYLDVLRQAQQRFPDTVFHIHQEEVRAAVTLLMDNKVDLVINPWSRLLPNSEDLQTLRLDRFELINVCRHRFAEDIDQPVSSSDAIRWHQIVLNSSENQYDQLFGVLEGSRRWYCNTSTMKQALIQQGMGWGKLPKRDIDPLLKSGELKELKVEGMDSHVIGEVHLMRRINRQHGPVAQWLWQQFSKRAIEG